MQSPCTPRSISSSAGDIETSETKETDGENGDQSLETPISTIDKTLLKYKTFYLLFFAGFGSTFPYLTIYFKQLGLSASFVGTLSGVRPLVQFVSGPFWAYIADKYHARKLVLSMSVVAWLVMTVALAFPQPQNTKCHYMNKTTLTRRDLHLPLTYPSLPLLPMPAAVSEGAPADKKTEISFSIHHDSDHPESVIIYDKNEVQYIFNIFLVLIVVGEFFEAPSFIMIDTALIQQLGDKYHNYGKTRLFGSVGYGLASFGVGAILDTTRYVYCGREMNNYMVIFYFFVGFMIIGLIFVMTLFTFKYDDDDTTSSSSSIFAVYKLCLSLKYSSFLLTVWFMGIGNGGQVTFINWFLEDLGASKFTMGLASAIRCSAVIIGFFFSGAVINRLGEVTSVFWSLLTFAVIFFGYSYLVNPWLVVPLEILQGFVYAISWSTCIVYLSAVTPDDGAATMQSILQGVYWGLGTGIGAILGGFLISHYGIITSYRIGGVATVLVTVQFVLTQWFIRKYETSNCGKKDEVELIKDTDPYQNNDVNDTAEIDSKTDDS